VLTTPMQHPRTVWGGKPRSPRPKAVVKEKEVSVLLSILTKKRASEGKDSSKKGGSGKKGEKMNLLAKLTQGGRKADRRREGAYFLNQRKTCRAEKTSVEKNGRSSRVAYGAMGVKFHRRRRYVYPRCVEKRGRVFRLANGRLSEEEENRSMLFPPKKKGEKKWGRKLCPDQGRHHSSYPSYCQTEEGQGTRGRQWKTEFARESETIV